jgi:RNA polymerase sigma factor (sigma-70 family)
MDRSDSELISACRRGEADAWQALVLRYQRLIYTVPIRAGLDEDTAGEVFQHVFLALYQNLDRIAQPERLHAWLMTTAKRETLRLAQRQAAGFPQVSTDDEAAQLLADMQPLPSEAIQQLEEQQLVRAAVERLGEPCRTLLTMLFFADPPAAYTDIAGTLGIPLGGIGPTRARCLQKLRSVLKEFGF